MALNHVGIAGDSRRGTCNNDDQVILVVLVQVQQVLIDGLHHLIRGLDVGAQEGLCTPGQRQLGAHVLVRGEYQKRQIRVQAGDALCGITRGGEGNDSLRVQALCNIAGGIGHHAALGARDVRQRRDLAIGLRTLDNARHGPHHVVWIRAHGGLARQHHRIGAVEHGVGHVGSLRTGWAGVLDHGIQHLGGHDDRLGVLAGNLDSALLE